VAAESAGTPLYRRIQIDMRERIASGELEAGAQVETELDLMARYGVSRATVRQALSGLVAEGLLEIKRGRGTFVHGAALEHRLGGFYTFSREIERHGMRPSTRVRQIGLELADGDIADGLGLAPGTPVVALSRIRLADDQPIVAETSYLPSARFKGLEDVDFSLRARNSGWMTEYLALAKVFHVGGGASRRVKDVRMFYAIRSRLIYGFKHFPLWQAWLLLAITVLIEPLLRLIFSFAGDGFRGVIDTCRGYGMVYKDLPGVVFVSRKRMSS
jgi:DNA-binding GntR family transcriptional regulator